MRKPKKPGAGNARASVVIFAKVLFGLGGILLFISIVGTVVTMANPPALGTFEIEARRAGSTFEPGTIYSPPSLILNYTIMMMGSTLMLCVASALWTRNLPLIRLIDFVFYIAIAGALPMWLISPPESDAKVHIDIGVTLDGNENVELLNDFEPEAVFKRLPASMLKDLGLKPKAGIRRCDVLCEYAEIKRKGRYQLDCKLVFNAGFPLDQRQLLTWCYAELLAVRARKLDPTLPEWRYVRGSCPLWDKYEPEWKASLPAE